MSAVFAIGGLATGWTLRGARNNSGETQIDWKTRLAARDDDLQDARKQLAAAAAEAQDAVARAHVATSETAELRAEVESLREHAAERDQEIERLEDLVIELKSGSAGPDTEFLATRDRLREVEAELAASTVRIPDDASHAELDAARARIAELEHRLEAGMEVIPGRFDARVEELEAELASLESRACPDPEAHHHSFHLDTIVPGPAWTDAIDDDDDDLPLAPVVSLRPLGDADPADTGAIASDVTDSDVVASDVTAFDVAASDMAASGVIDSDVTDSDVTDSDVIASDVTAFDVAASDVIASEVVHDEATTPAVLTDAPLFDEALYEDDAEATAPVREAGVESAEPVADDLTRIKGIGPQIGGMLNRMGIVSYRDLADLAELDPDEISERFNGLASRLQKGNWIEAARELHIATHGGDI
ncbi:MAG TPA: hypothetical protein VLD62_07900 [Acidimicrobiia bacterium]|nr:hypothetical protein [Acidimicrobiia bacterium]